MMPAILWKEYREHRIVWMALAFVSAVWVLSLSRMTAAGWFGAHPDGLEPRFVAVALVGVYALVCGAMMLAGEHENRTMSYLDALPGYRRRLWQGKFVAGVLLVLGQIVLLMLMGAPFSLFKNWSQAAGALAAMLVAGMCGLSWGMLFSSFGRSVINMILLSLAVLALLAFAVWPLAVAFSGLYSVIFSIPPESDFPGFFSAGIFALAALAAPSALIGSALVFTGLDRRRLRNIPKAMRPQMSARHPTWSMLFWLTWRQARGFTAGLALFALFLGFVISLAPVLLWPVATLIVGVLCGATAFADEQQGSFRFLGDQRLPLGRVWAVKVGVRFSIAVVAALVVLAPSFIGALANLPTFRGYNGGQPYHFFAHVFRSDLLVNLCPPGLFLTLWLVYGFAAGCLYGLLFRHGLAAGVFALSTSSMAAALWIPSLLGGGLHAWQVFGPPVLVLASTPLLLRPWAAGRIVSWTTALRLTPLVVLAALWIAGGLWYRVLEIPYVPPKIDLDAFRASLPTLEQDEGGRLFRSACLRFNDHRRTLESQEIPMGAAPGAMGGAMAPAVGMAPQGMPGMAPPGGVGVPGMPGLAPMPRADDDGAPAFLAKLAKMLGFAPKPGAEEPQPPSLPPLDRARKALEDGWPTDDKDLAAWMDKLFAGEWLATLKQAAELPTSPFDDVRDMTFLSPLPAADAARNLAVVLAVRGLQRQAAGDDAAHIENLRIGLALSRSMRNHTPAVELLCGRSVEATLLTGLERWLEKLHGRPELIRQALSLLSRHLEETAEDGKDQEAIAALSGKNILDNPIPLLEQYLSFDGAASRQNGPSTRDEAEWIALAWLVPWEQARQDRIFRLMYYGDQQQQAWFAGRGKELGPLVQFDPMDLLKNLDTVRKLGNQPGELRDARAMQLKLALRWYQADNGKPAETLDELVPKYLPSVPIDPFDPEEKPLRYRLSRGEEIEWPDKHMPSGGSISPPDLRPENTAPGSAVLVWPPPAPKVKIPAGQGILWSVGPDKIDDGGHRQVGGYDGLPLDKLDAIYDKQDVIYLVPLPAKEK